MFEAIRSLFQSHSYENLEPQDFLSRAKATPDAVLLDVRTPAELKDGKIEEALHFDFYEISFRETIAALDKRKSYFIYCRSGIRSARTCRIMQEMGFEKLYNMAGGLRSCD